MVLHTQVLRVQGLYYVLTGVWPLVHLRSFEAVTGPKTDDWLVHMVGLLVVVIGATLLVAARPRQGRREVLVLAVGSAIAFTMIDVWYVVAGTISRVYLADAGVEVGLIILLVLTHRAPSP